VAIITAHRISNAASLEAIVNGLTAAALAASGRIIFRCSSKTWKDWEVTTPPRNDKTAAKE